MYLLKYRFVRLGRYFYICYAENNDQQNNTEATTLHPGAAIITSVFATHKPRKTAVASTDNADSTGIFYLLYFCFTDFRFG